MPYSSNSIAACVVTVFVSVLQLVNFGYACSVMHAYRHNSHQRQQKHVISSSAATSASSASPRSYPFLIRLLYLLSNACALTCIPNSLASMLFLNMTPAAASSVIHIDPWRRTSLSEFDLGTRLCAAGMKVGSSMYVWTKLFSYLFFFIKQRTVRPLSAPSKLEKFTLLLTLSVVLFAIFLLIVAEPEPNAIDQTCQLLLPVYTIVFMAGADATISILYLYLFIQPLRETIALNRNATKGKNAVSIGNTTALQAEVAPRRNSIHFSSLPSTTTNTSNNHAVSAGHLLSPAATLSTTIEVVHVTPATTAAVPSATSSSTTESPQLNTALEAVMRKNTYACIFTIIFSLFTLNFMVWSHVTDEPSSRKWVVAGGSVDIFVTCAALSHIMHKSASSNTSSVVKKNQVVPMIQQHGERNKSRTSVQMANEKHQQRRPSIQMGIAQTYVAPPSLPDATNKSGWTAQLDTMPTAARESMSSKNTIEIAARKNTTAATNEATNSPQQVGIPKTASNEQHMIDIHRRETESDAEGQAREGESHS